MDFDRSEINLKWKIWKIYSSIYKYKIYEILILNSSSKNKKFSWNIYPNIHHS